ncbi:MAG: biosynthetic-type acetolactate synthase large subunit [Chloroflexota bacterium]|jgi:acetolactate synthase-1/2/3 large subunit|uniref:acetolactate synthase n=1 Tax=marine metagenome TaxID=408172 RepID=A0A381TCK9_9ZZZZ|nr:acetolactate synthase, large subunit, biosynthetic type [Dehalococcoidia bacterium]MBV45795.1 acetolactate synthase, large subunit, biosynthetic type [Dehalococcoidia bacterium]MCH2312585.1 biosynthetic-type acetolactate synthase large subunit [SAR202 cluster bacterium]MEC7914483.1 biosynthetic-type acetolactate synthase large subunit [Chloroflexota bacterium]HAT22212.1 biosynthetic-type acetolactate synthase large subunit [Dehalococcoidia bacterium]|tara:strand:+ start:9153 stop:10847 length:1695 start_codon:yes stop_codon:yes gene_type:complete
MIKKGSQIVCESLLREGCNVVFGIPGGAILPLYQALPEYPELRHILTRHEQGASLAADGYARVTGKPGVAFATSGPGATNLVTGIACAQMDSVPLVIVTGQVNSWTIGSDAFQETDITGITLPITKHNFLVMDASEIASSIKEAFYIANSGRPGPVLVDIPRDVFVQEVEYEEPGELNLPGYSPNVSGHSGQIRKAANLINEAEKPVIVAGHGVIISKAYDELKELAEKAQIPVITTLLGISCFPEDHVLWTGWPGMHGMAYASFAIEEADLIIALGMRFDDRITGNPSKFALNSKKIHIDVDPSEIGKNIRVDVPIVGDVKEVLTRMNTHVGAATHPAWLKKIDVLKEDHPSLDIPETSKLLARQVVRDISDETKGGATIVTGVGQHQMWAAQHYRFKKPCTFLTSGGSGTMGYEVPAAMGAQVADPDSIVWSIAGDGGFQMTLCELATIAENRLPVKFAILNNGFLGMVRQWQEIFFDSSYVSTGYTGNPDFVRLAEAYGIKGIKVTDKTQVKTAIAEAMDHDGPVLVDFIVEQEENVYPMIPSGMTVYDMIEEPISEKVTN